MFGFNARSLIVTIVLVTLVFVGAAAAQQWSREFGAMGLDGDGGFDGEAYCLGKYQGRLVAGGWFEEAGDEPAMHVATWDGERWRALAGGLNQPPEFVLGTDFNLYVGGPFWQVDGEDWVYCARWDGTWHEMAGLEQAPTCATFDGFNLWIGGSFSGLEYPYYARGMLKWTGGEWDDPGSFGYWDLWEDEVKAIADGFERLHLGGDIMRISGPDTTWGHMCWNLEEGGIDYGRGLEGGHVEDFVAVGADMWIGGSFSHADGQRAEGLVLQASGGTYNPAAMDGIDRDIEAMTEWSGGLHVAANEGDGVDHHWVVRRYGNQQWSEPLGGEFTDGINDIFGHADGDLYVAGYFDNGVVRWDDHDEEWVHLGGGIGRTNHDRHWFKALVAFEGDVIAAGDDVRLPAVIEGQFDCENVVRWHDGAWHRLGNGLGPDVSALAVFRDELYAGLPSGEGAMERIQRWTGEAWEDVVTVNNQVLCMTVHEGELVVGGLFTDVDGVTCGRVAAFDGVFWRALDDGMDGAVRALYTNDGILYAAGSFTVAGAANASRVARYVGGTWQAMGEGFADGHVHALTAHGGEIHAGGSFTASGDTPLGHVARWDGAAWQPLGDGVAGDVFYGVAALRGTTAGLYVGGDFTTAGGAAASGLAVWDGAWSAVGEGVSDPYFARATVSALLVHEGDLYVAGHFTRAGDVPSYCIAVWEDGTLVPNLLQSFRAVPRDDGTVALAWQVAPALAQAEFRLLAATGDASWEVPVGVVADGSFAAHDTAPGLSGAPSVHYRLAYRHDGRWQELDETRVSLTPPRAVRLRAAVPNPFNPSTTLAFELDRAQVLRLDVHDLAGRRVARVASGAYPAGRHTAVWHGCDDAGRALPSGTYLVRLVTESAVRSQKVMLAR